VKGSEFNRQSMSSFFHVIGNSPILRIGIAAFLLAASGACDTLGLGGDKSPMAPGTPAPGSTIVYTAVGASDANGVGSSVPL